MQHTCHVFCMFRSCLNCSSSIPFYLFSCKQPEILAVISWLSFTGKDQIRIWAVLFFSIYNCQEFLLPTWYSTRYHLSGGESNMKNCWCHFSLPLVLMRASSRALTESHIFNAFSVPAVPDEASTHVHQEVANDTVNTRSVPSTSKKPYHHNQPAIWSIKATASSQAEDELHLTYGNENAWQSVRNIWLGGNCTVNISMFFWRQMCTPLEERHWDAAACPKGNEAG